MRNVNIRLKWRISELKENLDQFSVEVENSMYLERGTEKTIFKY